MNWATGEGLIGCDDPEEVDAAFDRGEPHVGVAVIGLSLNCPDAEVVALRIMRLIHSEETERRGQGVTALSHMVRLTQEINQALLERLRELLRNPESREIAEDCAADIWIFVPHHKLPIWMHLWAYRYLIKHKLSIWWWSVTHRD
ncbi:hypothetical protein Ppa06_68390 [Planomonospora parontospora subsp. parontospora]|uniref:Uncharacterized protein n=2 Tax=Planomonospora parontospora TaxID=58119 RepID=A0ABQ4HLM2_9ACTN|nr:hypothetical protein Ppa06_68390 [Planomonospora parontospora subsp. parontospora]